MSVERVLRLTCVAVAALVAMSCRHAAGEDAPSSIEALRSLEERVRVTLGPDWIVSATGTAALDVVRRELPAVFNYTSRSPHEHRELARETDPVRRRALLDRWRVNIRYRIVVRVGPLLSQTVVDERLVYNRKIRGDLERAVASGLEPPTLKMAPEAQRRYEAIWKQEREIPCGTYGNRSVYVTISDLGAADASPLADEQYHAAASAIVALVQPYARVRHRTRRGENQGVCAYNLYPPSGRIPFSCPW